MMPDQQDFQVNPEAVIAGLERQLGAALGQITRLEVALGQMVKQLAEAGNVPAPDKSA